MRLNFTSGSASFLTLDFEENKSSSSSPPKGSAKKISIVDIVGETIPKTVSLFSLDWEGWGGEGKSGNQMLVTLGAFRVEAKTILTTLYMTCWWSRG